MALALTIVTPSGTVFQDSIEGIVLPGSEGRFGVLEGHERFLAPLRTGVVEIQGADGTRRAALSAGFADVSGQAIVVLAEACEFADEIDLERAERARRDAQAQLERLQADNAATQEIEIWATALSRAMLRIEVGSRT